MNKKKRASGRLTRANEGDRMIGGVCSGIANHYGHDPTLVRLLWALGTLI